MGGQLPNRIERALCEYESECIVNVLKRFGFEFDSYVGEEIEIARAFIDGDTMELDICCDVGCALIALPMTMFKEEIVNEIRKCTEIRERMR